MAMDRLRERERWEGETERQRDRETERDTQRDTERHRETQRDTERHRETDKDRLVCLRKWHFPIRKVCTKIAAFLSSNQQKRRKHQTTHARSDE